jgi:hypothetical protein
MIGVTLVLSVVGDKLVIRGPRRAERLMRLLLAQKSDVLQSLDAATPTVTPTDLPADWHLEWDCRAAIMEYDGGLPREQAEAAALADILDQMHRVEINPKKVYLPIREA